MSSGENISIIVGYTFDLNNISNMTKRYHVLLQEFESIFGKLPFRFGYIIGKNINTSWPSGKTYALKGVKEKLFKESYFTEFKKYVNGIGMESYFHKPTHKIMDIASSFNLSFYITEESSVGVVYCEIDENIEKQILNSKEKFKAFFVRLMKEFNCTSGFITEDIKERFPYLYYASAITSGSNPKEEREKSRIFMYNSEIVKTKILHIKEINYLSDSLLSHVDKTKFIEDVTKTGMDYKDNIILLNNLEEENKFKEILIKYDLYVNIQSELEKITLSIERK